MGAMSTLETDRSADLMDSTAEIQDPVYALAASPNFDQGGLCFAACASGLYRSENGGLNWASAYLSLNLEQPLATAAVALSPNFKHDGTLFSGVPGGVLRSIDRGQTWEIVTLPSPPPVVSTLVVSPAYAQDGTLFAGTLEDGIFRSADRGRHWSAWNFGLLDLNVLCLAVSPNFAQDELLFAGTDSGIFRSTNGGRAWREVDFSINLAPVLSLALSPNYANDGVILAGTESHGLWYSDSRGSRWNRLAEEHITGAVNGIILAPEYPARPYLLALLSEALLISRNNGQTWSSWSDRVAELDQGVTAVAAPCGMDPGAPLLIGLADGRIQQI